MVLQRKLSQNQNRRRELMTLITPIEITTPVHWNIHSWWISAKYLAIIKWFYFASLSDYMDEGNVDDGFSHQESTYLEFGNTDDDNIDIDPNIDGWNGNHISNVNDSVEEDVCINPSPTDYHWQLATIVQLFIHQHSHAQNQPNLLILMPVHLSVSAFKWNCPKFVHAIELIWIIKTRSSS